MFKIRSQFQLGRGVRGFESASPRIMVARDKSEDPMEHSRVFRFPCTIFFSMDLERILHPANSMVVFFSTQNLSNPSFESNTPIYMEFIKDKQVEFESFVGSTQLFE
ncbi:hypothetical protein VNO77_04145 [Canavalia gladiata]|uniref:Uncharacterized protein n=1 Tax=Canavalia gladiata TaxID=3824 RepID=A0AAN9R7I5_CANGL